MIPLLEARQMLSIADTWIERFVHVDDGVLVIRAVGGNLRVVSKNGLNAAGGR